MVNREIVRRILNEKQCGMRDDSQDLFGDKADLEHRGHCARRIHVWCHSALLDKS